MNTLKLLAILFMGMAGVGLSACETVDGAGQDIENLGEAIQD